MEPSRRDVIRRSLSAAALPALPVRDVLDFGAKPDGAALNTAPFQKTVDEAAGAGGGVVYVPPGDYVTGTIRLKANVTLYVEAGATVRGSAGRSDYTEGCLVYAEDAPNVSIRGRGVIDGNGTSFFVRKDGRWSIGAWRPSRMMQFVRCENLLIEDVTLRNSPAWTVHPVDCDRVNIRGVSILNGIYGEDGPNTDGINPDGCSRVRISDCYVQTGDDCIVLKCTRRPGGGAARACRDVTVTNCVLITTETALKIGSETYGEFRNITFSNCAIRDGGCGVGLWMRDGGVIDGWTVNNISMTLTNGGTAVYLWAYPRSRLPEAGAQPDEERPPGTVRNVLISDVVAEADGGVFISGLEEKHIEGVTLDNIRILMRGSREKPMHADPPYPFRVWGHRHAPYDIFCRYVDDLKLRNIQFTWGAPEKPEWGSAIRCWHVTDLEIDGFEGRQSKGSAAPAISLRSVRNAFVRNCRAPEGTGVFLETGVGCEHVTVMNNDLRAARVAVEGQAFEAGNRPPRG